MAPMKRRRNSRTSVCLMVSRSRTVSAYTAITTGKSISVSTQIDRTVRESVSELVA